MILQIFNAYCTRKGLAIDEVNFLFEGTILQKQVTPDEVRTCMQMHNLSHLTGTS